MAKKDFSNVGIDPVYETIAEATAEQAEEQPKKKRRPRRAYSPQEAAELMETLKTAGRKGLKLPRMNMAFTPSNYQYIEIMSKAAGYNLTQFVNMALLQHRTDHEEEYRQVLELREKLKN